MNQNLYKARLVPTYQPSLELVKGLGSRVWDREGNEYLDLTSGIAVSALGHCHPDLVNALSSQAQSLWHTSNLFITEPAVQLADTLCQATFAEQVFFANSGAEANEAALKLARKYASENFTADKNQIISCTNSFHGRTLFTITTGGKESYKTGYAPLPEAITHVTYNDIDALTATISHKTCAVIIEIVQGEGGVNVAGNEYLERLRELCNQYNALLIVDEVQTGIGRTGKLFAYMHSKIAPDILTTAKALGNGMPISAMLTTKKIASSFSIGSHGTTYGGNPLACKVALEVIRLVNQSVFLTAVADKESLFLEHLHNINSKHSIFSQIRSKGLLIGAELNTKYAEYTNRLILACQKQGLLVLTAGNGNVVRILPPLNISTHDINLAMEKFSIATTQFIADL